MKNLNIQINQSGNGNSHCLVGLKPLSKQKKDIFQITIIQTHPNKYIGIGIVTQEGKKIKAGAYKTKEALVYYASSGNLYTEGAYKHLGAKINEGQKVKVQVNIFNKQISWYANDNLLGTTNLDQRFLNINIYPIIQISYQNDTIRIEDQ